MAFDHCGRVSRRTVFVLAALAMSGVTPASARGIVPASSAHRASRSDPALPRVAARIAERAPLRIIAFGSSSTEGAGASSPSASYPSRLQQVLAARLASPVEVLNRGVGGEDADDMVLRLPAVLAEKPDLLIWQTGTNDPLRDVPLARFAAATRSGIAMIRATGADVMLIEPQLCERLRTTLGADRYRLALRQIGAELHVPVVRRFDLMRSWLDKGLVTEAALMSGDGLHMADAGYALLALAVAREVLQGALLPGTPAKGRAALATRSVWSGPSR
jgi:lysophospholipase L1-like esterase